MGIVQELVYAASDAASFLTDTCNIRRYAQTQDGFGGSIESWVADTTSTPIRTWAQFPGEPLDLGSELRDLTDSVGITLPLQVVPHLRDRILVDSQNFEVFAVNEVGNWGLLTRAHCVYVEQPYTVLVGGDTTIQPVHAIHEVSFDFFHAGPSAVAAGHGHRRIPGNWQVLYVATTANVAPTGGTDVFDVLVNGTSLFTSAAKPQLASGQTRNIATPDNVTLHDSDDMIISTLAIAGLQSADVTVQVVVVPLT